MVNEFRWFLNHFSNNFIQILQALFSIGAETTLKILGNIVYSLKVSNK